MFKTQIPPDPCHWHWATGPATLVHQHPNVGNYVGKTSIILSQHGNTSLKQFFENSGLSRNRWFHFADVLGTSEPLQVRWDQYLEATSRPCPFWFKTLGLARNHKSKDNVYVGIHIYIYMFSNSIYLLLYMCAYNNSQTWTWTKGSKIQDSLCRNLQGVRLATEPKLGFYKGKLQKAVDKVDTLKYVYIYIHISSGFKSTLHNFLKPILKFQSHSWALRPSGSRETPAKLRNCIKLTSKLFHMLFQVQGLAEGPHGSETWNMKNDCLAKQKGKS